VALPLTTTGDDGAIYHIAEAKLFLDGPQSAELVIGANAGNRFERHIAPGAYTLHVLGNVRVRRMYADGSVKDFVASLVGDAPTFDIVSGEQTPVRLDLEITVPTVDSSPTSSGTMLVDVVISFVEEVVECLPATVDKQSCGWNLEGMKLRMCEDGHWGEWTPCTAPDACDADTGIACPQAPLVTEVVLDTLTSPPSGCTGATYHTFNDCRGGFWHVVTQATYQCGTKQVVTEVHIIRTNQACESGAPVPDLADFLGVQPGNCQAPATLFTYHIPTCVHGMWQRLAYDLIQCADGSLYASRRFAADQQTTEPCDSTIATAAGGDDANLTCDDGQIAWVECTQDDGAEGSTVMYCGDDGGWMYDEGCDEPFHGDESLATSVCPEGVVDVADCELEDSSPGFEAITCSDGSWVGGDCQSLEEMPSDGEGQVMDGPEALLLACSGLYQNWKPGGTNYKVGDRVRIFFMHRKTTPLQIKHGLFGEVPGPTGLKSQWDLVQSPVTATCPIVAF